MSALTAIIAQGSASRPSALAARRRDAGHLAPCRQRDCRRPRHAARPVGRCRRRARRAHGGASTTTTGEIAVVSLACPDGTFPSVGALHPPAIRLERAIHSLYGLEPVGAPDTRPWLDLGFWGVQHPLGARTPAPAARTRLRVSAGGRRKSAPNSRRPGACRHHRAGTFPLHRQRRDRGAARSSGSAMCTRVSSR